MAIFETKTRWRTALAVGLAALLPIPTPAGQMPDAGRGKIQRQDRDRHPGRQCALGLHQFIRRAGRLRCRPGQGFADYLGLKVEFVPLAVANRIPSLRTGKVDALFASMGMTPERAKNVQYAQPYAHNVMSVYATKDKKIANFDDLTGMTVGAPKSSPMDTALTAGAGTKANILRFDDDAATIQAILSGQIEAIGGNQFYGDRLAAAGGKDYEVKFDLVTLYNSAATRPGEKDWNEAINAWLDKAKANGDLAKVYAKWMKRPVPDFPASLPDIPYTIN